MLEADLARGDVTGPEKLAQKEKRERVGRGNAVIHRVRGNWKDIYVFVWGSKVRRGPVKVGAVKNSEGE